MTGQKLPTYQDLVNALCDVMDGMQDHDIQSATGLPDEECDFIANVRRAVKSSWDVNGAREYRYQDDGYYVGRARRDNMSSVGDKDYED